jgi:DNA-binding MarR family transcriptional regulator
MKVKEITRDKFMSALQNIVRSIKNEFEDCGKMCGGINEKELHVIDFIGRNKNVKMSDIADNIDAPMSTLTNIVDKLVEKKFLSREHSDDDRRVINVMLTNENGQTAFQAVASKKQLVAEKALAQFNEKEQDTFIDHMNILASSLGTNK